MWSPYVATKPILMVARQLAGGARSAGAAFFVTDGSWLTAPFTLDWTSAHDALARGMWHRALLLATPTVAEPPLLAVIEHDGAGVPHAALFVEAPAGLAEQRVLGLRGLACALLTLHRAAPEPAPMTPYQRWLLSENPRAELVVALERSDWNVSALADEWQVARTTLYRQVHKHRITLNRAPMSARRLARRGAL